MQYVVKQHPITRKHEVHFRCPSCARELHVPLRAAGLTEACPDCAARFRVPGEAERKAIMAKAEAAAQARQPAGASPATDAAARLAQPDSRQREHPVPQVPPMRTQPAAEYRVRVVRDKAIRWFFRTTQLPVDKLEAELNEQAQLGWRLQTMVIERRRRLIVFSVASVVCTFVRTP